MINPQRDRAILHRQRDAELPQILRPVPVSAADRARPFWLELGVAVIFSLGALIAVSGWLEHCSTAEHGCLGLHRAESRAPEAPTPSAADLAAVPPEAAEQEVRPVLSHAFAPLPLSFQDHTTRDYVLPPGQSLLDLATNPSPISLDQVALIAVVQQGDRRHALVRLPDGRILRLQQGDMLDGETVAAISEDALYLMDADQRPRALVLGG